MNGKLPLQKKLELVLQLASAVVLSSWVSIGATKNDKREGAGHQPCGQKGPNHCPPRNGTAESEKSSPRTSAMTTLELFLEAVQHREDDPGLYQAPARAESYKSLAEVDMVQWQLGAFIGDFQQTWEILLADAESLLDSHVLKLRSSQTVSGDRSLIGWLVARATMPVVLDVNPILPVPAFVVAFQRPLAAIPAQLTASLRVLPHHCPTRADCSVFRHSAIILTRRWSIAATGSKFELLKIVEDHRATERAKHVAIASAS